MLKEHSENLSKLSDRWRNLEERIKEAEQISGTVVIPAINELRYAGRRFFEAWLIAEKVSPSLSETQEFQKHLYMAEQYFNNADHDLADSLVMFFSERKNQLLEKYGLLKSTEMYPRIVAWMEKVQEAQQIIRSSRGNRHNRLIDYDMIKSNLVPKLCEEYKDIIFSEKLYLAKFRRDRFFSMSGYVIGVLGLIVGSVPLWLDWDRIVMKLHQLI